MEASFLDGVDVATAPAPSRRGTPDAVEEGRALTLELANIDRTIEMADERRHGSGRGPRDSSNSFGLTAAESGEVDHPPRTRGMSGSREYRTPRPDVATSDINTMAPDHLRELMKMGKQEKTQVREGDEDDGSGDYQNFPPLLLHPYGTPRSLWDMITLIFLFAAAIQLPLVLAFRLETKGTLLVFTVIQDSFFCVDIILNFFTAVEIRGAVVTSRRRIAYNYATTWLLCDVAAVLPLVILVVEREAHTGRSAGKTLSFSRVLKLLKTFKLLRVVKAFKLFRFLRLNRVLARLEYTFIMKQHVITMVNFLLLSLLFCHLFACAFYAVAAKDRVGGDFRESTWVAREGLNGRSKFDHYVAAFYWTVMIVTTVGLGDIGAWSTEERAWSIVVMIFGAAIFTVGTSSMIHLRDQLQWKKRQFAQSIHQLNLYMDEHKISANLRGEIREHAVARAQRYALTLTEEQRLLEGLTLELRSKLSLERNLHFLQQINFMKGVATADLLRAIAAKLHINYFDAGDVVVREGSDADAMFFIVRGAVEVLISLAGGCRSRRVAMLSRNQFFGEGALVGDLVQRNATVRAILFTEARAFSRADAKEVLKLHAEAPAPAPVAAPPGRSASVPGKVQPCEEMDGSSSSTKSSRSKRSSHPLFASMRSLLDQRDSHNKQTLSSKGEAPSGDGATSSSSKYLPPTAPTTPTPASPGVVDGPAPFDPPAPKVVFVPDGQRASRPSSEILEVAHPVANLVHGGSRSSMRRPSLDDLRVDVRGLRDAQRDLRADIDAKLAAILARLGGS